MSGVRRTAMWRACNVDRRQIAREGRKGRRTGALFTIGRPDDVVSCSRPLILDPLSGHAPAARHITNPDLRGTIKALAQLDGACIFAGDGTAVAAGLRR
jgi:DNA integrity scanning protein DisA with diadenylate cyclase activity